MDIPSTPRGACPLQGLTVKSFCGTPPSTGETGNQPARLLREPVKADARESSEAMET